MKKIIILSYYQYPCTHPVLENIFADTLGKSFEVIWLFQGDRKHGRFLKWHNSKVYLCRVLDSTFVLSKLFNKVLDWGRLVLMLKILALSREEKIVLVRDMPFWALLISFFKKHLKFKLYYQHSAPLPEISYASYMANKGVIRYWYFIKSLMLGQCTIRTLKRSDLIFPITTFYKEKLLNIIPTVKCVPLTMGVNVSWLRRNNKAVPELLKLKGDNYILCYFGTLSFARNPKFLINILNDVKKKIPNCKLLLLGRTQNNWEEKNLKQYCQKLDLENDVIFTGQLNVNKLQDYLGYCDISISAIPPESHYIISSPTKLYESLGNGVPVVANYEIFEQKKVIDESNAGVLVPYKEQFFADEIIKLLKDSDLREKMVARGKDYVIENYDYRVLAERIKCFF